MRPLPFAFSTEASLKKYVDKVLNGGSGNVDTNPGQRSGHCYKCREATSSRVCSGYITSFCDQSPAIQEFALSLFLLLVTLLPF